MDIETAVAIPLSPVSCKVTARDLEVIQDKPESAGGTDAGMMASEHLLVALLSCQLSTFYKVAAKRGVETVADSIQGDMHFDESGNIGKIVLTWKLTGGEEREHAVLMRLTDKVCTISRALSCPVEFSAI